MPTPEQCAEHERFERLDAAFKAGDLDALRANAEGFPGEPLHPAIGLCLPYAIYWSPLEFIRELLDAGADPNAHENDGFPPLIAAFDRERFDDLHALLELLLDRGADPNIHGMNDYTPLHLAAARGDLGGVELLLARGADPNEATRIDDYETPLELASKAGHAGIVARLNPLTTRLDWESAAKEGDIKTLSRLLRDGYDIDKRDGFGQTALMRAAHAGKCGVVEWLIANGAELNHTSKFGLTALMLSVIAGYPQVARVLAKAGADKTIEGTGAPGFAGKTAADLAAARGDRGLEQYLRRS
ncbi:MAG: ankyrin repeat domain-containing protein [Bryobacterales bacterium]